MAIVVSASFESDAKIYVDYFRLQAVDKLCSHYLFQVVEGSCLKLIGTQF